MVQPKPELLQEETFLRAGDMDKKITLLGRYLSKTERLMDALRKKIEKMEQKMTEEISKQLSAGGGLA